MKSIFLPVPKSPNHMGLICVKKSALDLVMLGPLPLKGQCHEIFCFWFFSWISFPPAPDYPITTVSNFFENSRRYSQVKVHHLYQRHWWQICHWYQRHRRQNCRWYQRHRWQICQRCQQHRQQILPPVWLVLLIPNLPPVSLMVSLISVVHL